MPRWVASVPRRTILRSPGRIGFANLGVRSASTHVSPTAINLRPNIPPRNQALHDALSALGGAAEAHVNTSRLQLALRGLAAHDAVTRIAVLGLDSQLSARRLARLLLADPLGAEEAWEKELANAGPGEERGAVLLKYGDASDAQSPSPSSLYELVPVPSRVLQSHNLEVLVSTLNVNDANATPHVPTESSTESLLVPKLQATSARGLPVPFPVHKTVVLAEGLDTAIAFGRFSAHITAETDTLVKVAVDLPAPSEEARADPQAGSAPVNIDVGTEALDSFRESIQNSVVYERGWFRSGLPILSSWLLQGLQPSDTVKPAVKSLIASIADQVEMSITKEDTARLQELVSIPTSQDVTASIVDHLESWAETSHAELRDELDEAFSAKNWHKLSWWKLFWRVDDVTMISTEILERRWLVSAEKSSIFLAGRMNQAGFSDGRDQPAAAHIPEATTQDTAPTAKNPRTDLSTNVRGPTRWSEHISTARTELIDDTVPPLQALAQRLILQTFSTTSLSSAASAILYASMSSFSVFEASAVAALGLTFSLRRMQSLWEGARESWQGTVREEGRRTLKHTEEAVRLIIRKRGRKDGDVNEDEDVVERRIAREAVQKVREVLDRTNSGNGGSV
ncbi:hypothetical protein BDW02DRAFT_569364 [Decorospora gaudefroyi]|uniref:Mmc1 C-terminal domain-containing protein n=1 Tax=Decorospora gaudefroyi TaxID=184978 RepID=A0A6A5KFN4_9PLEO|nr:hypothetical protein BDW02DRAFT_569364 [Decorospora gaudefroyi]